MTGAFWLDCWLRSAALLLAGQALLVVFRKQGPAFRHRLIVCVLTALALFPLLSIVIPPLPFHLAAAARATRASVSVIVLTQPGYAPSPVHTYWNFWLIVWLSGAAMACAPLAIGGWRITQQSRRAQPFLPPNTWIADGLNVPLACGILHSRILLPTEALHWSAARLQAVLEHERAHLKRHDVAWQTVAHLVAALWWFQPLVWLVRRQLRQASEFACDEAALQSGLKPSDYASELLAVARRAARTNLPALAMAQPSELEARVRAVLRWRKRNLGQNTLAVTTASILLLVAVSATAAGVVFSATASDSDKIAQSTGGSLMKRTILSALVTSAGLSAATIGGNIRDTSGAPVADAKVTLDNPDDPVKQSAVTQTDGSFTLDGGGAGGYILHIEKPGFVSIFREFTVDADARIKRDFTMVKTDEQPIEDKKDQTPGDEKPIRIGSQVAQNNLIKKIPPLYPVEAKQNAIQGTVQISATISKEGVPTELRVVSSPDDSLSQSALEAVRQWRYRPTLLNGQPINVQTLIVINYTLAP